MKAPVTDEYYAMIDSGTNAVIVPLCPEVRGEIAECKVPSATVEGPIVQVLEHQGKDGESEILVCTAHRGDPSRLSMKNGLPLPYLSQELFWRAMQARAEGLDR